MSKNDEVLQRAYGNMPKEVTPNIDIFDWIPTRGIRYFWLKFIRFFTR